VSRFALLCLLLSQCSLGPSSTERAEAGRISRAIDLIRAAPNAQKGELLDALKSQSCEAPDLCELQKLCVDGFGQHVLALSETARAKTLIAAGDPQREAESVLTSAQTELAEAAPKISRCADAQGAAQRKYKF
jgi:hypothetical protein